MPTPKSGNKSGSQFPENLDGFWLESGIRFSKKFKLLKKLGFRFTQRKLAEVFRCKDARTIRLWGATPAQGSEYPLEDRESQFKHCWREQGLKEDKRMLRLTRWLFYDEGDPLPQTQKAPENPAAKLNPEEPSITEDSSINRSCPADTVQAKPRFVVTGANVSFIEPVVIAKYYL